MCMFDFAIFPLLLLYPTGSLSSKMRYFRFSPRSFLKIVMIAPSYKSAATCPFQVFGKYSHRTIRPFEIPAQILTLPPQLYLFFLRLRFVHSGSKPSEGVRR